MEIKVYPITEKDTLEDLIRIIRESPAQRIVLLAEAGCPALRETINLRLLRFYSDERQVELVVIARDPVIRREAEREGLYRPDFDGRSGGLNEADDQLALEFAAHSEEGPGKSAVVRRPVPALRPNFGRLITASAAAFFTLLLGAYLFFSPRVTVAVYPVVESRQLTVQAQLSPDYAETMLAQNRLPGRVIERRSQAEYSLPATGKKTVGYKPATGKVTFYNGLAKPFVIPKGTEISTASGIVFVTVKDGMVPAKTRKTVLNVVTGENYGQLDLPVEAVRKGVGGNVPRNTLTKLPGNLGKQLQVTNFAPAFGGEDRQIPVVTQEDIARCVSEVRRQMELAGPDEIRRAVGPEYAFLPELVSVRSLETTPSCQAGDEADQVSVKLVYAVKTTAISKSSLYKYIKLQLHRSLPPYLVLAGDPVRIVSITAKPGSEPSHDLSIQAETTVHGRLDRARIINQIAGRPVAEARTGLNSLPEIGRFELRAPSGMTHIPRLHFQIRLLFPSSR